MDIKDFWAIFRKRWYVATLVALGCVIAAALVVFVGIKPVFEAFAKVLVEQPARVVIVTQRSASVPPSMSIETHIKLLQGMEVAKEAVRVFYRDGIEDGQGRRKSLEEMTETSPKWVETEASKLRKKIQVFQEEDTGIITIRVEDLNPKRCAELANAFKDAFIKVSSQFADKTTQESRDMLQEQLDTAQKFLDDAEENLFNFQNKNGVVNLDEEFKAINNQIIDYELSRKEDELKIDELERKIDGIETAYLGVNASAGSAEAFITGDWFRQMQIDLTYLEVERANLLRTMTRDHPKVIAVENRIAIQQEELERKTRDLITRQTFDMAKYLDNSQVLANLRTDLQVYLNRYQVITNVVEALKEKLSNYPSLTYEFGRLQRSKSIAEQVYFILKEKEQQAMIDAVQNKLKVTSLEDAIAPKDPFKPNRWKNIGFSAALGLFLGVFFIFLLEEFEESIKTGDQVTQYLSLPVLGTIPYSTETINKLITDIPLKSPLAEAYRRLSFFTQLFCLDPPVKSLLITSSKSDEGKSTTLANLAISMAQEGTRVLVIDTDLRRPMLHRMFGVDNSLGLSSILSGELEAELAVSDMAGENRMPRERMMEMLVDRLIQPLDIKGLSIMPSGPLPANSVELLRSERMLTFLEIIGRKADIVLFDSPPAIHVIDAVVLAQILDGVLLVINSGRIKRLEAINVKQMIESTKTPIIGVALNNIEQSSPDYYYYYYYGGYGYGSQQRRKRVKLRR